MSDIGPDTDLSPQAVQVLAGWLRQQEGMQAPPGGAPGVPELVLYLCGALPPGETFAIEERLLATKSGLRQLRVVRTELLRLEAMPWQAVAAAAQGEDPTAAVASAWLALTATQVRESERAPARWLADGWQTLRGKVESGVGEALAAWNSFLAFGAQWGRELRAPGLFALERGAETQAETILPGITAPFQIEARIDTNDALHVTLQLEWDAPDTMFEGRSVLLALRNGTQVWPLAHVPLRDGFAEWHISGFGAATGMPAGEIPRSALLFALADQEAPAVADAPLRLLAEITDREGVSSDRDLIPIIFLEEPRWFAGEFRVRVEIPAEARYWLSSGYQLRLDVAVSGAHWQHLGTWTLAAGDDAPHTLQAPCPGSLDVILPSVTLIRAQLRPPE